MGGENELNSTIKKMRMNKAEDENGMIAEYLKALTYGSRENLRGIFNGVMNVE